MPGLLRRVQQPVVERLVTEGNAAELLPAIHIPSADAHTDLLGLCVFMVVLTHSQQHSWRSCAKKETLIRLEKLGRQTKTLIKSFVQHPERGEGQGHFEHGSQARGTQRYVGHGSLLSEAQSQQAEERESTTSFMMNKPQ